MLQEASDDVKALLKKIENGVMQFSTWKKVVQKVVGKQRWTADDEVAISLQAASASMVEAEKSRDAVALLMATSSVATQLKKYEGTALLVTKVTGTAKWYMTNCGIKEQDYPAVLRQKLLETLSKKTPSSLDDAKAAAPGESMATEGAISQPTAPKRVRATKKIAPAKQS